MDIDLKAGSEPIAGFRLSARLARGGSGEVWKAAGPGGFDLAMKFIPLAEEVGDAELRAMEMIKDVRHPHLLTVFGVWRIERSLIIGMELAERTLLDRFREAVGQGLPGIPAPEVTEYFVDAARALDFLNEPGHPSGGKDLTGLPHRDIKPTNLLLVGGSVKVGDFGLASILEGTEASHAGGMMPAYAAPESFDRKTSSRSDQYSLAVTYCHLRGGRLPFTGSFAEIMAGHLLRPPDLSMLPPEERAPVARALAKDPKDRWPNCRAFLQALNASGIAGGPAPSPETSAAASMPSQDSPGPASTARPEGAGSPPIDQTVTDADIVLTKDGRRAHRRRWIVVPLLGRLALLAVGAGLLSWGISDLARRMTRRLLDTNIPAPSFPESIASSPREAARRQLQRGDDLLTAAEYDAAIAAYDEAIRLEPESDTAHHHRGLAWRDKGDVDRAIADYTEAIRLNPRNAQAYSSRAVAWYTKEEYGKAIADDDEAIRLDPKNILAYTSRAFAFEKTGQGDRARADREKVEELRREGSR